MAKIESIWRKFESGVGFSNGCAAFAFTYPPPFVPSILIATCEAIGPCTMVWVSIFWSSITGLPSGIHHRVALVIYFVGT